MSNYIRLVLLFSFLFSGTLMYAQIDGVEKDLLARTNDFDSVILLYHSAGWPNFRDHVTNVKGYGIKHNKCYKLYILLAYDSAGKKTTLASILRQEEPEAIGDSVRNIPFSAIINFKRDSLDANCSEGSKSLVIEDGETPHLTVIKNHKMHSAYLYGAYFSEPCGTLDRIMFVDIQGKIQRLFSITKYKI